MVAERVCIKLDGAFNSVESVPSARSDDRRVFSCSLRALCGTALQQPGWHQCPRSETSPKRSPRCHDKLPSDFVERDTLTPCASNQTEKTRSILLRISFCLGSVNHGYQRPRHRLNILIVFSIPLSCIFRTARIFLTLFTKIFHQKKKKEKNAIIFSLRPIQ